MQNSTNMRILELLRFLYERTDENHPATVSSARRCALRPALTPLKSSCI